MVSVSYTPLDVYKRQALMSQYERYALTVIASDTSGALLRLHEIIQSERHMLSELPAMLLEILVLTPRMCQTQFLSQHIFRPVTSEPRCV